jgi:hypothetical protein
MTPDRPSEADQRGRAFGWRTGSFTISTAAGRIEVDWIVPPPFGTDEGPDDEVEGSS